MARQPTVAEFHVITDPWGYRVFPPQEDLFFSLGGARIEIFNHLRGERISIEFPDPVVGRQVSPDSVLDPLGDEKAVVLFRTPPTEPFEFYVVVDSVPFRARADSDPRVNPK